MPVTAFVSHEHASLHDTGWSHPDHQGRLPAIVRAVQRDAVALWEPLAQMEAVPAVRADLLLVHTPGHVDRLAARAAEAAAAGRTLELDGVPVSGASWDAAVASVGAALTAADAVLRGEVRNAFVLARPPGVGARPDSAGGHSLFNSVAVLARWLVERRGLGRVVVVVWGVEPPRALADALGDDARVRVAAVHRGVMSGGGFARAQREALGDQGCDFVVLSAGFDVLAGDPEGGAGVEVEEVHALTAELVEWAAVHAGGRLVSVLEGGYDAPATARAVVQHLRALAGVEAG
jgi:acetoin utilization deacetylase AcuC-like enzyme